MKTFLAVKIPPGTKLSDIGAYVKEHAIEVSFEGGEPWVILRPEESLVKKKLEAAGKPLGQWEVKLNMGITTGYNEAFVINREKKDAIFAKNPQAAEIIKPVLRGRDLKRYAYNFADLWIIYTPWHFPLQDDLSIHSASDKAEAAFREQYPAVYEYLLAHKEKLLKRSKEERGKYEWYALTRYKTEAFAEFSKPKIVWPSVSKTFYSFVPEEMLLLDTNYFLTSETVNLKYLLGVMNSRLFIYMINQADTPLGNSGGYRHYKYNLEQIPIPVPTPEQEAAVTALVEKILAEKTKDLLQADTSVLEAELDRLVYALYGLTDEDIAVVEYEAELEYTVRV